MKYPKYLEYCQPEIDSSYLIPSHWEEKKFRFLFSFGRGLGITKSDLVDEGIACINYGEIHSKYGFEIIPEKQKLKCVVENYLESSVSSLLNNGDFVFSDTSEDLEGSGNFAHLNSNIPTFAGYHTVIARPTGDNFSRYLAYFIDSSLYRSQIRKSVSGVKVFSITQAILKNSYIWIPPLEEQKVISAFLDNKIQKIDRLIEKKRSLIEKLEENRIAIITQAVTKGIDENVNLKFSEVSWLGDVPEHWKVAPIKFALEIPITDGPHETPELFNEGIPFLSAEAVKKDKLDFSRKRGFISEAEHRRFSKKYVPKRGDVYMVKSGATTGNVARVETDEEFNIWSPLAALRPNSNMLITDFLFYYMKSKPFFYSVELSWSYGTQQNIGMGVIANLKIALPPVKEQFLITDFLTQKCSYIDEMQSKAKDVIDKLSEYRAAIITSAVTGQIDVRAIEIPKEVV